MHVRRIGPWESYTKYDLCNSESLFTCNFVENKAASCIETPNKSSLCAAERHICLWYFWRIILPGFVVVCLACSRRVQAHLCFGAVRPELLILEVGDGLRLSWTNSWLNRDAIHSRQRDRRVSVALRILNDASFAIRGRLWIELFAIGSLGWIRTNIHVVFPF